jgi:hypothetical protein
MMNDEFYDEFYDESERFTLSERGRSLKPRRC